MNLYSVLRFAWIDLFDGRAWRPTVIVLLSLGLTCGFIVFQYGRIHGGNAVEKYRLDQRPDALRLWAGDSTHTKRKITPAAAEALRIAIETRLPEGEKLRGVLPFRISELDWEAQNQKSMHVVGCTMNLQAGETFAEHFLIKSSPLRSGKGFDGPNDKGVVVCPGMLKLLKAGDNPPELRVWVNGATEPIRVAGVFKNDLPGFGFVMLDAQEHELTTRPDPQLESINTGPVPEEWLQNRDAFGALTKAVFPETSFRIGLREPEGSPKYLVITQIASLVMSVGAPPKETLPLSDWQNLVNRLGDHLDKNANSKHAGAFCLLAIDLDRPAPPPPVYDMVAVYLRTASQAKAMNDVCADFPDIPGLSKNYDKTTAEQVALIDEQTSERLEILDTAKSVIFGLVAMNLAVIQFLLIVQKTSEIGMMRAMGAGKFLLFRILVSEASILWFLSAFGGVVAGLLWGWCSAQFHYDLDAERSIGFQWTIQDLAWILAFTGAINLFTILPSNIRLWRWPPMRMLSDD